MKLIVKQLILRIRGDSLYRHRRTPTMQHIRRLRAEAIRGTRRKFGRAAAWDFYYALTLPRQTQKADPQKTDPSQTPKGPSSAGRR